MSGAISTGPGCADSQTSTLRSEHFCGCSNQAGQSPEERQEQPCLPTTSPRWPSFRQQVPPRRQAAPPDLSSVLEVYHDLREVFSGLFFVNKDASLQPCIDYRALNVITKHNKYPLTLLDTAFAPLHKARIFTKLDLRNAYHLLRIHHGDEWKTAFNRLLGHFVYQVMPFGLINAPAVFQALVNNVLQDMFHISFSSFTWMTFLFFQRR